MQADIREIPGRQAVCLRISIDGAALSFEQFAANLSRDAEFQTAFNETLAKSTYEALRWELPGLTATNWTQPFECVLVESLELRRSARWSAFEEHFDGDKQVVTFANLRGDATLVVPLPIAEANAYPHLAAFARDAPTEQQRELWQMVGEVLEKRIGAKPVWLSTAGAGIPWLHVRLDDRPKYYSYAPYRSLLETGP
ncbi:hypothetical protein Pan97_42090 [Bremerella volcania]|uniref:Uncharacterized protein n=1 Tax=Bremerella volcania TaxID=2527984 RepID=A0A518CD44_9BACT|nr:hypothetical protein [Bremerella volcania]QDU77147.1 hypothetical protein Pan97_42090 [Bremerella volcania]